MKNIIILLLSIIAAYSFEQNSTNHKGLISNGIEYDPEEFPYVVTIYIYTSDKRDERFTCTGTLIKVNFVLTAAHCVLEQQAKDILVSICSSSIVIN